MDAKIITGFLLCFYLIASISISQSAHVSYDGLVRSVRQNDETDAGSTADGLDIAGTTEVAEAVSDAADAASAATEAVSEANDAVSDAADAASAAAEAVSDANEAASAATDAVSDAADAASAATEAVSEANDAVSDAADAASAATEAVSDANEATDGSTATVVLDNLETSTIVIVDNGTDVFTSVQPAGDEVTDSNAAGNDTVTDVNETTEAAGVTGNDVSVPVTLEPVDENGNGTQSNDTAGETTTTPAPVQPGGGVQPAAQLRVVVNPEVLPVQYGRTVEFTCIVYGGDANTNVYWIQEQPERRYALLDAANENDKQVTASQVTSRARITLDDPSKIGTYTCMAQDASGNSGSAVLTMQQGGGSGYPPVGPPVGPPVAPGPGSRYLRIIAPDMTEGDYVEIQCDGVAPEDEGNVQWYFNNRLVNDEQPLFPRGKTLHIRPISRAYLGNYRCAVPGGSYVEGVSVLTFGGAGGPSGTPAPAPVPPPVYGQCTVDEATCRNGRCIPRSYLCDGKNDCGDNSDEACGPNGQTGSDVCQPNEVRCADSSRGRKCVQKFWTCDGDRDCDDGSDEQQSYCQYLPQPQLCRTSEFRCTGVNGTNGNPVCIPRAFQCDGYTDCPDRSDEIGCAKPTIVSTPERQVRVNTGETLVLRCTARGAPAPYINWRLNWGFICGDGSDNGRCSIAQNFDNNDPTLVTCTLTVRNVNRNDAGAYSCEALNNQGFIFAIPDAIVNVDTDGPVQPTPAQCNCHGHSSYCSPDGRCQNCQHNTAGYNCEYCASGYQGNARQGTPYDCQPVPVPGPSGFSNCDASGTYTERDGRCVCKYNVQGDRCNQCKPSHFYLNPSTPNGCLPCFCSGVSTDCTSTDWKRQALPLPLYNWNVVPKNFATDSFEAGDKIKTRDSGRELALDQNSLGRSANEVLYWKAPKSALGDVVTLYDGNIDIYFANDGDDTQAPTQDEYIWLRGNNIDLVHKFPSTQRFKANTNATYSVPVNERTFTRKDGTYIDRENILMALSDLDTLLVKINPIGGRKSAVLRGVTLNVAAQGGYADAAPTVESCRCPANYTGTSCEKCAEGYGRPHPLVGIYLGQCWACRSICNERSDTCDRDTGKCSNCRGNSEGDRCERCQAGYVLDGYSNQCVLPGPGGPSGPSTGTYINGKLIDPYGTQLTVDLDGSRPEQRIPVQLINAQAQSVVWTRADGSSLPAGVVQEGNDLVIRNPSAEQAGNYLCTITHPDGSVERFNVYLNYRAGTPAPDLGGPPRVAIQPRTINLKEGQRMIVQYSVASHEPITVVWNKLVNGFYQPIPSLFTVEPNRLVLNRATPDAAGTYQVVVRNSHGEDKQELNINVEPRRRRGQPQIRLQQTQYQIGQGQTIDIVPNIAGQTGGSVAWSKDGSTTLPEGAFARDDGFLRITGQSSNVAGQYQITVTNARGQSSSQTVTVQWTGSQGPEGYEVDRYQRVQWNQHQIILDEGRRLEAVCRSDTDPSRLRLDVTRNNRQQREQIPLGLSFSNGYLSLSAVTQQDNGLEFICSADDSSDLLVLYVQPNRGNVQDGGRSFYEVRLQPVDAQSVQVGQDIQLQCAVQGSIERPYEYTYTKDGQPLANNVEVHPNGILIIRNAQASDSGRYQCQVNFPRAPEFGTQQSNYDLVFGHSAGHAGAADQGANYGYEYGQQAAYVEVSAEPTEASVAQGEKVNITCVVKGAQQYTVKWGKYAHDTTLPDYARQQGDSIIVSPTNDSPTEQMYLQCQVDVPGNAQPYYAYTAVNVRGGDQSSKKKKKRRS